MHIHCKFKSKQSLWNGRTHRGRWLLLLGDLARTVCKPRDKLPEASNETRQMLMMGLPRWPAGNQWVLCVWICILHGYELSICADQSLQRSTWYTLDRENVRMAIFPSQRCNIHLCCLTDSVKGYALALQPLLTNECHMLYNGDWRCVYGRHHVFKGKWFVT
jgi:hypothetical protein